MSYKASAPGSVMMLGEYAVLYGKPALVCAIDRRVTVTYIPRPDDVIHIESSGYSGYETNLQQLKIEKPFQFVLGVFEHFRPKLRRGADIRISTDFSDQLGLGSSAAVTVATMATIVMALNIRMSALEMVRQGQRIVRNVQQGLGSGADVAAAVFGGVVSFQAQPLFAEKFALTHPLTLYYSGSKTPTATAIKQVEERFTQFPHLYKSLHTSIGQCATAGVQALRKGDWEALGKVMNMQQGLMTSLGVSNPLLQAMVEDLQTPNMYGAKISGAGMGDCVVALGEPTEPSTYLRMQGVQAIPVTMTVNGVHCEKI